MTDLVSGMFAIVFLAGVIAFVLSLEGGRE